MCWLDISRVDLWISAYDSARCSALVASPKINPLGPWMMEIPKIALFFKEQVITSFVKTSNDSIWESWLFLQWFDLTEFYIIEKNYVIISLKIFLSLFFIWLVLSHNVNQGLIVQNKLFRRSIWAELILFLSNYWCICLCHLLIPIPYLNLNYLFGNDSSNWFHSIEKIIWC